MGCSSISIYNLTHLVVIDAGAKSAEEIDRLPWESIYQLLHISAVNIVMLEDAHAHTNAVLQGQTTNQTLAKTYKSHDLSLNSRLHQRCAT